MDKIDKASSEARMKELEKDIFGVFERFEKKTKKFGFPTIYEVTKVLIKAMNHYCERGLTYQYEQAAGLPENHGPREVGQDIEAIRMTPQGEA